ncbi:MAG: hypothetical protein AB1601_05450 [Planctomycetota bacterium]
MPYHDRLIKKILDLRITKMRKRAAGFPPQAALAEAQPGKVVVSRPRAVPGAAWNPNGVRVGENLNEYRRSQVHQ